MEHLILLKEESLTLGLEYTSILVKANIFKTKCMNWLNISCKYVQVGYNINSNHNPIL